MKNKKEIKDHDNNHEKKTKMSRRPRNHTPLIREKRKKDPMRWGGFGPEAMLVKQAIDFEDQTYPEAMGRVRAWLKQHHMVVVVKPDFCNADCWDPDMGYVNSVMEDDSLGEVYYCRRCAESARNVIPFGPAWMGNGVHLAIVKMLK